MLKTCPTGNCPPTNGVYSTQWIEGSTTGGDINDTRQSEWMSNLSFYVGTGYPNGQKVGQYIGVMQGSSADGVPKTQWNTAGTAWALNTNIIRNSAPGGRDSFDGYPGSGAGGLRGALGDDVGTIGYELDFTNWDKDCGPGQCFAVGMYVHTQSSYSSLAGIYFDNAWGAPAIGWHDGILFQPSTASGNAILDSSNAAYSYQTGGTHEAATFYDTSAGPVSLLITGSHTIADIVLRTTSTAGISVLGSHSGGALVDASTGDIGVGVTGTHSAVDLAINTSSPASINITGRHSANVINDASTSPAFLDLAGTYARAAIDTESATTNAVLAAKAGQKMCLSGTTSCVWFDAAMHKWYFSNESGVVVASIAANTGNLIIKGTLTQNGTP